MLKPGNHANVRIALGEPYKALLVVDRALGTDQGQKYLLTVDDKNVVQYRPVTPGKLEGRLRVIETGLTPSERVIVSGSERLRPGMTVVPKLVDMRTSSRGDASRTAKSEKPAAGSKKWTWSPRSRVGTGGAATLPVGPQTRSVARVFSHAHWERAHPRRVLTLFHRPPDLRLGTVDRDYDRRAVAMLTLPIAQYPEIAPPTVQVACVYPGASAKVVADTVAAPIEQQVNGVENMLYMSSQCTNDGAYSLTDHLQAGHRPGHGPGAGPEPRVAGHAGVAGHREADGRDHRRSSRPTSCWW